MPVVKASHIEKAMRERVDINSRLMTDERRIYRTVGPRFAGGHERVIHANDEYVRGDATGGRVLSIIKRGMMGVYHSVSREHLHRDVAEFEFCYNARKLNDGDRTSKTIRAAEGRGCPISIRSHSRPQRRASSCSIP